MEEVVKIDLKGLFARIFGLKIQKDDKAEIDEEVAKIEKISSGISWEDWEGQSTGQKVKETKNRRKRLSRKIEHEINYDVQTKSSPKRGTELEKEK